jgi:tRNA G18 (ribose-2'-O)-methylase SpoU
MQGSIESLNAAMAAGILMFEAARQRRRKLVK